MTTAMDVRPTVNGRVIGLGLGRSRFVGGSGIGLVAAAVLGAVLAPAALAGPEGAKVSAGQATIHQRGNTTVIRASNGAIIDYTRFDIGANERVKFVQPGSAARVLNRIDSAAPTRIDGSVTANGIVYFANPAGVIFGPTSVVDVGGIYAAAGTISNKDFLGGIDRFTGVRGEVVNGGRIDAGFAALVGQRVANTGSVSSRGGVIAMVSGDEVVLSERGGTISVKVDAASAGSKVEGVGVDNSGTVRAAGGRALMVAGDMYSLAVRNTGTVKAREVRIDGRGARSAVQVSGTVDASGRAGAGGGGGRGGSVAITADRIDVAGARIDASGPRGGGTVEIGGGLQGSGGLRRATAVRVDGGSSVSADATRRGDGGRVVVWSDHTTGFYGSASASGGSKGGDGGLIETSGKVNLDVRGARVDASARSGKGASGTWLMDPVNVTIADPDGGTDNGTDNSTGGVFAGGSPTTFDPDNSAAAVVDVNTVNAALGAGTSVRVVTGTVGTDAGNITVAAPISKTAGGAATLSLEAANNVVVNANIGSTVGALSVSLVGNASAGDTDGAAGNVTVNAAITTNGGTFSSSGVDFTVTGGGSVATGGGDVGVQHTGVIDVAGTIDADTFSASTVTLRGADAGISGLVVSGSGGVALRPASASSAVSINGAGAGFAVDGADLGNISVPAGALITVGAAGGTGAVDIGSAGPLNLSALNADLTVLGGAVTVADAVTLGATRTLTFAAASVTGTGPAVHVTAGTLSLGTTGSVGLRTSVGSLATSVVDGDLTIDNAAAITLNDLTVGGNLDLRASGSITGTGAVGVTGSTVLVTRRDGGAAISLTGANVFNGVVTARSRNAAASANDAGPITLNSVGDVTLGQAATTGAFSLTADGNISANGAVSTGAATLTSTFAGADITVAQLDAAGDVTVSTTGAGADVTLTNAGTITLGAGSAVGGDLFVTSVGGGVTVPAMTVGGTTVTLYALGSNAALTTGSISGATNFTVATVGTGSTATVRGAGDMLISANVPGTLNFVAGGSVELASTPAFTLGNSLAVGTVRITAPDVDLGGTLAAGGAVTLQPDADARTVGIDAPADFSVSGAGLNGITAPSVTVGRSTGTGAVTVGSSADIDLSGRAYSLTVRGGALAFARGLTLPDGTTLTLDVASVTSPNTGTDVRIGGAAGTIDLNSAGAATLSVDARVMTADATTLDLTTGGPLALSGAFAALRATLGGDLTVSAAGPLGASVAGGGNAVTITTPGALTVAGGDSITGSGVTITAADLVLDGTIDAGSGTVSVARGAAGTVGVGDAAGDLRVSKAELQRITAGTLALGGSTATAIAVDNVALTDVANIGVVALRALADGADVTFSGAASTFRGLTAQADDSVAVDAGLTATGASGLSLQADADGAADAGGDRISVAGGVTIATSTAGAGGITLSAPGGIAGAGNVTVNSNAGLTINAPLSVAGNLSLNALGGIAVNGAGTAQAVVISAEDGVTIGDDLTTTGTTRINADADGDGSGTLTVAAGKTVLTTNSRLEITAADLDLQGSLDAGTDVVAIAPATASTIGLGAAAGGMAISAAELGRITARELSIGNGSTTLIAVDTVGAGATSGISGQLTLIADDLDVAGPINTSGAVLAIARGTSGNIFVGTGTGGLDISNAELARIVTPALQIGGGATTGVIVGGVAGASTAGVLGAVTLRSNNSITFAAPASQFKTLVVRANNGVNINSNLTTTEGSLDIDANADGVASGGDRISIADLRTVSSAGDLVLRGSGGTVGAGALTLLAAGDVNLGSALTTAGSTVIRADRDGSGAGSLVTAAGTAIGTAGSPLEITAADAVLGGSINAGAGSVSIGRSAAGTIGLGEATGDLTISNAELTSISATGLTVGGASTTAVTAAGVTAAASNGVSGVVTLEAGAGSITFNGGAAGSNQFNALSARASGQITVAAPLVADSGALTLASDTDGAGGERIRLGANVSANIPAASGGTPTTGFNTRFSGGVLLTGNVTVTGRDVTFGGRVDSDSTARSLTVNTINGGVTSFNGDVGGASRLSTLTTNRDGRTRLGGLVRATGTVTFDDALKIARNTTIDTIGGLGVVFTGAVDTADSVALARSLTVLVGRGTNAGATTLPVIAFGAPVGQTRALRNLRLNYDGTPAGDGRAEVPGVATIVARPFGTDGSPTVTPSNFAMVFNTTGSFVMGRNEKLTSGGSLRINAPVSASLGDVNALGNLAVNSPAITINRRAASTLLGNQGVSGADEGVDFVVNGTINFTSTPAVAGSGRVPYFGTPDGSGDVSGTLGGFVFQDFDGPINASLINSQATGSSILRTLDLRSNGPTNTNVAETIAGAVPRESRQNDVGQQNTIGQAQQEQVKNLGIVARNPTSQELVDYLSGAATYDDFPRRFPAQAGDYTTVVSRLPAEAVTALLASYEALFNRTVTDEAGRTQSVSRADEIKESLRGSVVRFREASGNASGDIDPGAFRAYLEQTAAEAQTLDTVRALADVLAQLDRLGLTSRELTTSKSAILTPIRPRGIRTVPQLEAVIRADAARSAR